MVSVVIIRDDNEPQDEAGGSVDCRGCDRREEPGRVVTGMAAKSRAFEYRKWPNRDSRRRLFVVAQLDWRMGPFWS